jgi:hypothetical protein
VSPATSPYLEEWAGLLDRGLDALLAVATEDTERARALRQSSPFTRILSPAERHRFLRAWRASH